MALSAVVAALAFALFLAPGTGDVAGSAASTASVARAHATDLVVGLVSVFIVFVSATVMSFIHRSEADTLVVDLRTPAESTT